jgi:hypothetical protein
MEATLTDAELTARIRDAIVEFVLPVRRCTPVEKTGAAGR